MSYFNLFSAPEYILLPYNFILYISFVSKMFKKLKIIVVGWFYILFISVWII